MTNDRFATIEQTDLETVTGGGAGAGKPYAPPLNKSGTIDWPRVNWNKLLTGPFFEKQGVVRPL